MSYNHTQLIHKMVELSGLPRRNCEDAIDAFAAIIGVTAKAGGEVKVRDLGTFTAVDRAAKKGRNPKTGEAVDIPARRALFFRPAKQFRNI